MDPVPFLVGLAIIAIAAIVIVAIISKHHKNRTQGYGPKRAAGNARSSKKAEASPWESTVITPADIQIGDWVNIGEDYLVEARLDFVEGHYTWTEYWLTTPKSKVWVSVEKKGAELEVIHWNEVPMDDKLKPGSKKLTYNGVEFKLIDDGEAKYRSTGPTDLPDSGTCEYFDYKSTTEDLLEFLSFERFDGDEWEMAEGFDLGADWASITPGAGRKTAK